MEKSSEHMEQVGFVNWFNQRFPNTLIFAIPNGEHRSISVAMRLKAEGVVPGIPDLYIPKHRIWIEMKRKDGKLSKDQETIHRRLMAVGDTVIVGYGAEDASRKFLDSIRKD